jgi:DNA-binding NtrC family response regulator
MAEPRNILVVEDSRDLRELVVELLQGEGHQVAAASDSDVAIKLLDGPANFDLMFTDVVMPGRFNGFLLGAYATKKRPRLKVLYTTGYASLVPPGLQAQILKKPWRMSELLTAIERAFVEGAEGEQEGT